MMDDGPLRASDMDVVGKLFAMRFHPGGSTGLVTLYVEDDDNYFPKTTFDRGWLPDLVDAANRMHATSLLLGRRRNRRLVGERR